MRSAALLPLATLFLLQCGGDPEPEPEWAPDVYCPGDPSGACDNNDGVLKVGAGMATITPQCFESWVDENGDAEYKSTEGDIYLDCGCDRICPDDEGWVEADEGEGDGSFQAVWLAGFQNGRPAMGVHDDLWARAVVFEQGDTRLAVVAVDLIGWFYDEVLTTREILADAGVEIDYLVVAATHQHEGPDTVGLWGSRVGKSGYQPDYAAEVREATAQAVKTAVDALTEVGEMTVGWVDSREYSEKGTRNIIRDSRDPIVIDERVSGAHFAGKDGETLVTLLNWGNHPEVLSDENNQITSDYSHYLRESVENGVEWTEDSTEGLGGMAIYLNGTVGGLMTPLGVTVTDGNGIDHNTSDFAKAEALGKVVAEMVLDAIATGEVVESPSLSFKVSQLFLPVDNIGFQGMFLAEVLQRELYNYDPEENLSYENVPEVLTEVSHLQIGSLEMLAVPGELFPELAFGGFDGSKVGNTIDAFIDPDNPNPPEVEYAPEGPYWAELLEGDHNWILGLANDELGYIVPAYDFEVHPNIPYLDEAEGDHYEETNSLGPQTEVILDERIRTLLSWSPDAPSR